MDSPSSQQLAVKHDALYQEIAAQVPRYITGTNRDDIISDANMMAMEAGLAEPVD